MKKLTKIQEALFSFDEIESIECVGDKECIDITVEDDKSFTLSNGIITHNSAAGGLSAALGREDCGFIELRGVPISAEKASLLKFLENEEMKLYGQVMGVDFSKSSKLMEDSKNWYEMEDGTIVNENDLVLVNGKWVLVEKLLEKVNA